MIRTALIVLLVSIAAPALADDCDMARMTPEQFDACLARDAAARNARYAAEKAQADAARKAEEQHIAELKARDDAFLAKTQVQRQRVAAQYLELLRRVYPNYNHIDVGLDRSGYDFTLYGLHPFLGRYTFAAGGQGRKIEAWIAAHAAQLRAARIVQVGVMSETTGSAVVAVPADDGKAPGRQPSKAASRI